MNPIPGSKDGVKCYISCLRFDAYLLGNKRVFVFNIFHL